VRGAETRILCASCASTLRVLRAWAMHPAPRMTRHDFLLGCSLILAAAGCTTTTQHARPDTGATSLQATEPRTPPLLREDVLSTQAAEALMRKDYSTVLALTATTGDEPVDAWLDYDRGSALVALGRTDEALDAFGRAELRFDRAADPQGVRKAMWGRARALADAGRCGDARLAYGQYQAAVRLQSPRDAELAASYAGFCVPRKGQ
jgi:hypothetical protein